MSFSDDPRPLVAVDWSLAGLHVTFDGDEVCLLADVEALLARLQTPHRIVAEATFESWDPQRKQALVTAIRAAGHEIYVFRPIHTARNRPDGWAKTDANDARVIFAIAREGRLHLYPLPDPEPAWQQRRQAANRAYQRLRLTGGKPALVEQARAVLGDYRQLDDEARSVLGNGRGYSLSLMAAVVHAAGWARSRREFERLLGLHGSAYPSLLRSEVHHHSFRHARRRGVDWPTFRRQLRRAYRQLADAGLADRPPGG